jgi:hypothetical protein
MTHPGAPTTLDNWYCSCAHAQKTCQTCHRQTRCEKEQDYEVTQWSMKVSRSISHSREAYKAVTTPVSIMEIEVMSGLASRQVIIHSNEDFIAPTRNALVLMSKPKNAHIDTDTTLSSLPKTRNAMCCQDTSKDKDPNLKICYQISSHEQGRKKMKEHLPAARLPPNPPEWTDPSWSVENSTHLAHGGPPATTEPQPAAPRHVSLT